METISETPTQVAIAVVQHAGRFLVGVRPAGKPLAGFAEFPGGKVEADETPQQAAIRECLEESGLRIEIVEEYFSTMHRYPHGLLEIHFFSCRLTSEFAKKASETPPAPLLPFRWITIDELRALHFPAANDPDGNVAAIVENYRGKIGLGDLSRHWVNFATFTTRHYELKAVPQRIDNFCSTPTGTPTAT